MRQIKALAGKTLARVYLYYLSVTIQYNAILSAAGAITVDSDGIGDQRNDYRNDSATFPHPAWLAVAAGL